MPDKTGIDLLREIRREGWNVPVVMITAYVDAVTEARARELGLVDLMKKPVHRRELLDLTTRTFGGRPDRR
jgi:DNA-binding response OmpR family regulator